MTMAVQRAEYPNSEWIISKAEGRALFESEVQRRLGISSEEFFRRWDEGEYLDTPDTPEFREIYHVAMLIPFGRSDA